MKVVILAGGRGSRLSEETKIVPKPMICLDREPIIMHIMRFYKSQGFNEFIILCGYKKEVIYDYFLNLDQAKLTLKIDSNVLRQNNNYDYEVTLLNTGLDSSTAERVFMTQKYIKSQFMLTYGDGLSDVNLRKLREFHIKSNKIGTITAVRPAPRFGSLKIKNDCVIEFAEKKHLQNSWINGGFFILNEKVFNYFNNLQMSFEESVLTLLAKEKQLSAFKHFGFWKPMDTLREKEELQELLKLNKAPWKKEQKIER